MRYLPDVVEVSVGNTLELLQLGHLIHHLVEVELRGQEVQPAMAVGLSEDVKTPD